MEAANFPGQPQTIVLGSSPRNTRACQGASAHQVVGRGRTSQMRGVQGEGKKKCEDVHPVPLLGLPTSRGTDKREPTVQQPHAGLPKTEKLGPQPRRPGQAGLSGAAPATPY